MEDDGDRAAGRVVVLGATNPIAAFLLPRLVAAGREVLAVARRETTMPPGVDVARIDVSGEAPWSAPQGAAVISILPLHVLAAVLPRLRGASAVVAVGSTSLHSKASSDDPAERATAAKLEKAEAALAAWGVARGIAWTVIRPTLVYDGIADRNVARMARFVRRFRVLPIARPSNGLRQPIHADDVVSAILGALDNPRAANRAFDVAGGEVLTYRAMAERVFRAQGLTPRFLMLPVPWLRTAFGAAAKVGILRETGFGSAVFTRMNQDLVFDVTEGLEVLGYRPRTFEPGLPHASAGTLPRPGNIH